MPLTSDFSETQRHDGITLAPTSSAGTPARIDGLPSVSVSIGDVTVEVDPNGAISVISGTPGAYEVLVEADADLGEGRVVISDTISGTITPAQATSLGLTAGTIREK